MMQIPSLHPDTIEEVKSRVDIYEVISDYVVLRKRGKDFLGLCPFHNEKTPSFSVSPSKQMYYCFGCHASGNAIKFLMELEKRSFAETVLDLARRYQVQVKTLEPEQRQELHRQLSLREQLYEVLAVTAQFYQHALWNSPSNPSVSKSALEYLTQNRQLQTETIKKFGLGYAPVGWQTLYRYLVENKNYPAPLVEKAGLIKPRKEGGGYYDAFRDRVMIPIRDILGRNIGFGGRTMGDDQPKYLNSPETELFNKGKTLFALDQAKAGISQSDKAVVVEGYFDAIALHEKGINNVVASLGTALSLDQVKLVLRYCDSKQLILNFDADKAGTNAAQRAIGATADLAYKGEVQLKILNIPDGKDADEYLQSHSWEDYHQLLANAPLWLDWQIQQVTKGCDLKQATDFQQVSQKMVKLLKKISNSDTRNYYVSHCAEILSLGDTRLISLRVENLLTQITSGKNLGEWNSNFSSKQRFSSRHKNSDQNSIQRKSSLPNNESSLLEQAEALLLQIYLHCPLQRPIISQILEERDLQFSLSHHRFFWRQILEISPNITAQTDLISRLQNRYLEFEIEMNLVSHLFHLDEKTEKELTRAPQVVHATTACMERVLREKRYRHYLELWQQTDPEVEPKLWQSYYDAFYGEKMKLHQLDRLRQFSLTDLF